MVVHGWRNICHSATGAGRKEIAHIAPSCLASHKLQSDSAMNLVKPMQVTCLREEIEPVCQKCFDSKVCMVPNIEEERRQETLGQMELPFNGETRWYFVLLFAWGSGSRAVDDLHSPIDLVCGLGVRRRDGEASRRGLLDHTSAALHHPHLWVAVVLQGVLVTSGQLHLGQIKTHAKVHLCSTRHEDKIWRRIQFLLLLMDPPVNLSPLLHPSHTGCPR